MDLERCTNPTTQFISATSITARPRGKVCLFSPTVPSIRVSSTRTVPNLRTECSFPKQFIMWEVSEKTLLKDMVWRPAKTTATFSRDNSTTVQEPRGLLSGEKTMLMYIMEVSTNKINLMEKVTDN